MCRPVIICDGGATCSVRARNGSSRGGGTRWRRNGCQFGSAAAGGGCTHMHGGADVDEYALSRATAAAVKPN